jgi:8-oxo-dGTP diphosphatase
VITPEAVFGVREPGVSYLVRPAAYAVILDDSRSVACVAETSGLFLPGGGIETGEDALQAVRREVGEECGREFEDIAPLARATQFFFHKLLRTAYELRASFFLGRFGPELGSPGQHELTWQPASPHSPPLYHECHRWAVQEALRRM